VLVALVRWEGIPAKVTTQTEVQLKVSGAYELTIVPFGSFVKIVKNRLNGSSLLI